MENTQKSSIATKGNKSMAVKIIAGVIVVAVIIGIIFVLNYTMQLAEYKKRIASISISNVDLSKISDGTYTGSYDAIMIAAKVSVDVSDHTIKDIHLIYHKNERGKKAEAILGRVQSAQSLKVDTITGATNSSKVLLKAVQNALDSAN